jgi:hypothetical protein
VSAAALRTPARWTDVVRAEAAVLLRSRGTVGPFLIVLLLILAGGLPRTMVTQLGVLLFFLPLLQWRGSAGSRSLDQALPVRAVAYEVTRVACGAAGAAIILCAMLGAFALGLVVVGMGAGGEVRIDGAWVWVAVAFANGMTAYLLGSAIMLRARRPGRVLVGVVLLGIFIVMIVGVKVPLSSMHTRYLPDGTMQVTYQSLLSPWTALLRLGLAAAAVWLSAWVGRRQGSAGIPLWGRDRGTAAARPLHPAASGRWNSVPRRPAAWSSVAVRQLRVQAQRMTWPLLATAVIALSYAGPLSDSALFAASFTLLLLPAFFWPALVWMDEQPGREWDQSQPAGTFGRRLLHAAAGLVWLEACTLLLLAGHVAGAARETSSLAGWVDGWVLPGVPMAVMAAYCLGTLPAMLARRPIAWGIAILIVAAAVRQALGPGSALSPVRVLSPLTAQPFDWSLAAALVWLPVLAALAVLALRRRVHLDRQGRFAT